MDHNHDPGANDTLRDIDQYMTNSIPEQHYNDFLSNHPANGGYDPSWDLTGGQVTNSSHDNWHTQSMSDQNLNMYTQHFNANQSSHAQSTSPYPNYQNPQPTQAHQAFDPSLSAYPNQQYFSIPTSQGEYAFQQPQQQQQQRSIQPQPATAPPPRASQTGPQSPLPIQAQPASKPSAVQTDFGDLIPASQIAGIFSIIPAAELSKAANARQLCPFVHVGNVDFEFPINKAVLPARPKRRSRNELRTLARGDAALLAKLGKSTSTKVKRAGLPNASRVSKPKSLHKQIHTLKGSKREDVHSSGDESSGSESYGSDSEEEAELPNPLPPSRPEGDVKGGLRYDALKAVFRSQRSKLPAAEIRKGLGDFWAVVQPIRAQFKSDIATLKEAKEKEQKDTLPLLEQKVRTQCDLIETVLSAALQHGHRSILATLSENLPFLQFCFQILLEVSNQGEIDSKLPKSVLECLAMCNTLTEDKLMKTRLSKVFPRFLKKGNAETQSLVRSIESKAKEATRFYETDLKTAANESSKDGASPKPNAAQSPNPNSAPSPRSGTASSPKLALAVPSTTASGASVKAGTSAVAGIKRPASGASTQPSKKVNGSTATAALAAAGPKKVLAPGAAVKTSANVTLAGPKTDVKAPVTSVKTKTAVSKPSAFFNNAMQSATKKPASAAKPAVSVVAAALNSVAKKPAEPAAKSSFSFADTMASLSKPAEKAPTPKPKEENLNETPEEKRKRLRKEARRGLRVTFKPDSSLVEVRFLEHDPNEDERTDSNMKRDVSDVGGEGRMFKQHKDQVDMDEDEDATGTQDLKTYSSPTLINFDDVDPEERERNVAHLGGGSVPLDSPEKDARETYEANTLIVYYANPADIPPTPKEPVDDTEMAPEAATKDFGAPSELAMERAAKFTAQPQKATADISAILAALQPKPQPVQPPQAQVSQQPTQPQLSPNVQALLSQLQQSSAPQPPPVAQQQQSAPAVDLTALLASLQGSKQPQPPPPPQAQPQVQTPAAPQLDLASLMASLQGNRAGAAPMPGFPPPPQPGVFPPPAFNASNMPPIPPQFLQQFQQMQQMQQTQQQQGYPLENEERRRIRETGGGQEQSQNHNFAAQNMPSNAFTQPCKYWPEGRCFRGNNCTFKH